MKRMLLSDILRLCLLLGRERTNNSLLPLIITVLNDRSPVSRCPEHSMSIPRFAHAVCNGGRRAPHTALDDNGFDNRDFLLGGAGAIGSSALLSSSSWSASRPSSAPSHCSTSSSRVSSRSFLSVSRAPCASLLFGRNCASSGVGFKFAHWVCSSADARKAVGELRC